MGNKISSLMGLALITLIILKLSGCINCSWWLVFMPLYIIPLAAIIFVLILGLFTEE
jgi:hypothetical protein